MRIISGSAKGARLFSPTGRETRPTRDFVKEAVFNIIEDLIGDLSGAVFLDLFAGTGAIGLEAKSRGAAKVYLVDSSKKAIELIKKNAMKTRLEVEIFLSSAESFLRAYNNFDIAFLDPPYIYDLTKIISALNAKIIIAERDKNSPVAEGYKKIKTYGGSNIIFY
jgi:16S rRNA (guanine966-N2)-methyltransferase